MPECHVREPGQIARPIVSLQGQEPTIHMLLFDE